MQEQSADTRIVIPYVPRAHFKPMHADKRRWIWEVCHRRAGKSVSIINHLQRANLMNERVDPVPRYAYVGPSFAQAKDIVWKYLKQYSASIPGMQYSESELSAIYPNGSLISLYGGASAYERMRGLYFDGAALDEYPLLHPDCFGSVVRPALSDYRGFGIIAGTSAGKDHFYELGRKWADDPERHGCYNIKVTDTDALHPDEVAEARKDMTRDQFEREYMNSFDAAVVGAYYGDQMAAAYEQGRVCNVPYDPAVPVMTCWDLGLDDETVVWFFQRVGREIHWIDYESWTNKGLDFTIPFVMRKPYNYANDGHIFPHDIRARELSTGVARIDYVRNMGMGVTVAPGLSVEDGINAARNLLGISWIDQTRCAKGIAAITSYQSTRSVLHDTNRPKPLHNWASHGADAFRTGATGIELVVGWSGGALRRGGIVGALRRNIRGIV